MKIFWSWQSDTPGKIGRHFVREALKEAIEELKRKRAVNTAYPWDPVPFILEGAYGLFDANRTEYREWRR